MPVKRRDGRDHVLLGIGLPIGRGDRRGGPKFIEELISALGYGERFIRADGGAPDPEVLQENVLPIGVGAGLMLHDDPCTGLSSVLTDPDPTGPPRRAGGQAEVMTDGRRHPLDLAGLRVKIGIHEVLMVATAPGYLGFVKFGAGNEEGSGFLFGALVGGFGMDRRQEEEEEGGGSGGNTILTLTTSICTMCAGA